MQLTTKKTAITQIKAQVLTLQFECEGPWLLFSKFSEPDVPRFTVLLSKKRPIAFP